MCNHYPQAHIEHAKKCALANSRYCKKDKNVIIEDGEIPQQGKRLTSSDLKKMTKTEIIEAEPLYARSYLWCKEQMEMEIDVDDWNKEVEVFYIDGESGIGKSQKAKEIIKENSEKYGRKLNLVKYDGNFWHNIGEAPIAVYDEWRPSHMPAHEFLNFIDYNRHTFNVKGGTKRNNYNLIIITSIIPFEEIYKNMSAESAKQWQRRIKHVPLGYPSGKPKTNLVKFVDYGLDD